MMNDNDKQLMVQMMRAGKYLAIMDLMPEYNLQKSKQIIEQMGNKWCCHPDNYVKKLEIPLSILNEPRIKVLKGKK